MCSKANYIYLLMIQNLSASGQFLLSQYLVSSSLNGRLSICLICKCNTGSMTAPQWPKDKC